MNLTQDIIDNARALKDDLHRHPEASFKENYATALITKKMRELGLEIIDIGMPTGCAALLRGKNAHGRTAALRADIDAINSPDGNGYFHGCGHDFHTACLYGAAVVLTAMKNQLDGNVVFIFQPAEEVTQGAKAMLEHGLLEKLPCKPDIIFGLHNRPQIPSGKIILHRGPLMAGKTNFKITINGKTGHGGSPELCIDPIVASASLVTACQTIVSRNTCPLDACVCSICSIHSGTEENFAPETAVLTGSIRALKNEVRENAEKRLAGITKNICQAYNCSVKLELFPQMPSVINEKYFAIAQNAAQKALGKENVVDSDPCLGSEDFAIFTEKIPGIFYWLGSGFENEPCTPWHSKNFHTNDDAIQYGIRLHVESALCFFTAPEAVPQSCL